MVAFVPTLPELIESITNTCIAIIERNKKAKTTTPPLLCEYKGLKFYPKDKEEMLETIRELLEIEKEFSNG